MHELYQKPTGLSPLLEICYDVAAHAHGDMVRTKTTGDIPYITHPGIVFKLLRAVGVEDELTLAASFLHDVMEDYEPMKPHGVMRAELAARFVQAGLPDGEKKAQLIAHLCEELTNAEYMQEGKRGWQWEHGQKLSARAKLVKVADQAATLVDDILAPSDRSYEKMRKFNMKSLECAKACGGESDLLDKLFKVVFSDAMAVMDGEKAGADTAKAEKAQAIRAAFSLDASLEAAKRYPDEKREEIPTKWRSHPGMLQAQSGVVRVGLTNDNKVCRFSMLVDPQLDEDSHCNKAVLAVMQSLEATSPARVTYQPVELVDERVVRTFKLKPPVAIAEFVQRAANEAAIEPEFAKTAVMQRPDKPFG